jgi:ubiquinone/menaquinone biosynthesis C-methylase UbiE
MTTINEQNIKETVQEKYGEIAEKQRAEVPAGCCGVSCGCGDTDLMADDYSGLQGYVADADLGLGCGLPTEHAKIKAGDTVIDLGSGAGNDAFVARSVVGEEGRVIGIDFTQKMIDRARTNAEKLKYSNVEFRLGDLEDMPVYDGMADVVVSNCVFNLVPNKAKAFKETFRVLKPGGHFSISDIVIEGKLPENLRKAAELYVGCVSGAIDKMDYLDTIYQAGFRNLKLQKEKVISLPDETIAQYLNEEQLKSYNESGARILSITVFGEKPDKSAVKVDRSCCGPECCN